MRIFTAILILVSLVMGFTLIEKNETNKTENMEQEMNHGDLRLGAFSQSLSVKDLQKSKTFYEHLGFKVLAGSFEQNYFIMKNENALIGIFHGMFEGNILTFNPGWNESGKDTETFDDVRIIQESLLAHGIALDAKVEPGTSGPANIVLKDPDGNLIMIDQHR